MRKEHLEELVKKGLSQREIGEKLNKSQTTIRYWLKKYNLSTKKIFTKTWDTDKFISLCDSETSLHSILIKLGLSTSGVNYKYAYELAKILNITIPKYAPENRKKHTINTVFKLSTEKISNLTIKNLMINELNISKICAICGQEPFWNGESLELQLDHINGINTDNRLENLRILCPNCHSQTETYCKIKSSRRIPSHYE